jgi:CDP-diacylglycerol--glycerol-3-phosphate 3-phosphatidyltransferase/cardiolipin synthase
MSLANKISVMRILLAPCIVASLVYYTPARDGLRFLALGLFLLGVLSDALDGFIARSQRQQSQLGTVLDPIADKLLILSALISLSTIRALPEWMRIPAWFNLIVISRDVVLVVGTMLIFGFTGKLTIKPSRLGKWTIAAQMLVVTTVLVGLPMKTGLLVVVAALTIVSGISYLRMGTRLLG